ncbi:hypothetical protein DY218_24130 [Streptomyces triticagri]|uniref:TauD/TfdA-like domain-containing protein n=1 Tax=Streptomyces triticagri TaxID=2293568 RepID=A0A372M0Z1_9ACTN|nr:TauD/TfdA family dioxygenase [Streptomyces triticagri]RFU84173.1 hypothetical protein DY218_24130 [Streptomyces triticagri]
MDSHINGSSARTASPTAALVPPRVDGARIGKAPELLAQSGALILSEFGTSADDLVVAAARVLGSRLREVYPLRLRASEGSGPVHLHADSLDLVVDRAGVLERRRHPDEDCVLVQCVRPAPQGGDSFAVDGYRLIDDITAADPLLGEFLTGCDVDLYGGWSGLRGLPAVPRVARLVEYTRAGRRIVRNTDGVVPLHRDPRAAHIQDMLVRFREVVRGHEPQLPRFRLEEGDILVLDNYRSWHGRDAHEGDRAVRILTLRTDAAA